MQRETRNHGDPLPTVVVRGEVGLYGDRVVFVNGLLGETIYLRFLGGLVCLNNGVKVFSRTRTMFLKNRKGTLDGVYVTYTYTHRNIYRNIICGTDLGETTFGLRGHVQLDKGKDRLYTGTRVLGYNFTYKTKFYHRDGVYGVT